MNFLNIDITFTLFNMAAFILAGSIHEWAHAFSAYIMGDRTAYNNGRMNLNPASHVDLFGTIIFPLFMAISNIPVIGWMRPVPVNPSNFRDASKGMAYTAVAGPLSNLFQAALTIPLLRLLYLIGRYFPIPFLSSIFMFFQYYYIINISLMVFNLLPISPLDGSKILRHQLSANSKIRYDQLSRFGMIVLYAMMYLGIFRMILNPVANTAITIINISLSVNIVFSLIPALIVGGIILYLFRDYLGEIKDYGKSSSSNSKKTLFDSRIDQIRNKNKRIEKTALILLQKKINKELDLLEDKKLIEKIEKNVDSFSKLCENRTIDPEEQTCLDCSYYANCLLREISVYENSKI